MQKQSGKEIWLAGDGRMRLPHTVLKRKETMPEKIVQLNAGRREVHEICGSCR